jgi:hypothetical protein
MYSAGRLVRRLLMAAMVVAVAIPAGGAIAQPTRRLTPTAKAHVRQQLAGTPAAAPAGPNQIMGAGDISADPDTSNVDDLRTSELMVQAGVRWVFTAGDNQYPRGQIEDFLNPDGYDGSWGRLKDRTCPTVGNHEYMDPLPGPAGHLAYFAPPCPNRTVEYATTASGARIPTVYAVPCAPGSGWWCYHLDSQCTHAEETGPDCGRYSAQLNWFRRHMAAHVTSRRLVFWHHPRFGNGAPWGDDARVYWLYAVAAHQGRVCLVVSGHSHSYERFTSMTADGAVDGTFTAPRLFTVGTGGAPLIRFSRPPRVGTRYRDDRHHGVLRLTLGAGWWASEFDAGDGSIHDRASAGC